MTPNPFRRISIDLLFVYVWLIAAIAFGIQGTRR
jgi:hypothetical protein